LKTIYIFERGILGWQSIFGDWANWPNQAISWIHKNTPHKAQTLTYFTGPILAGITRSHRANQFAKLLTEYKDDGWRIVLVAHSEGTATSLLALQIADSIIIDELHLICGACNSDCGENGLNLAVAMDRVKHISIYVAGKDSAMKLEDTYIGSACFGLQCGGTPMGLNGPENVTQETTQRTNLIRWSDYGHSDCWLPENFEATMRRITRATELNDDANRFAVALSVLNK
jgi:hypothetical protein